MVCELQNFVGFGVRGVGFGAAFKISRNPDSQYRPSQPRPESKTLYKMGFGLSGNIPAFITNSLTRVLADMMLQHKKSFRIQAFFTLNPLSLSLSLALETSSLTEGLHLRPCVTP